MFSNFYIRTNKEETRMSDIKVIKANATLNGRNKKKNTDSKRSRLFFLPKIGLYSLGNEEKRLLLVWGNISTPPMSCTGNSYAHSALREHINTLDLLSTYLVMYLGKTGIYGSL